MHSNELKEWVAQVFDGPSEPDVNRLIELDEFCAAATLRRLAEVFENAATLLAPYSDESIDQTFWNLSSDAFTGLTDQHIEWAVRRRFIESFDPLFREFFAARCRPALGHLSEEATGLNLSCYMWWDMMNLWYYQPDPLTRDACLASMRSILAIDHVACQESALHGLGHWHRGHPTEVEGVIDEYLQRNPALREELREYANSARTGHVQ